MRGRSYPTPETTGILSGKIWYMDVWLEQDFYLLMEKQHNRGQKLQD